MNNNYENTSDNGVHISLDTFVGQQKLTELLKVSISATKMRGEALSHVLLTGPRGSGKSTLATVIAQELGVNVRAISFNTVKNASDLAAILTNLCEGEVLLAENFDSIRNECVEVLSTAMDGFYMDMVIGKGPMARSVRIDLPKFTVIATMDAPKTLPNQLMSCFLITWKMEDYSVNELKELANRCAAQLNVTITDDAAEKVAEHSKGSYRQLTNVMKRARDFAMVKGDGIIDSAILQSTILSAFIE